MAEPLRLKYVPGDCCCGCCLKYVQEDDNVTPTYLMGTIAFSGPSSSSGSTVKCLMALSALKMQKVHDDPVAETAVFVQPSPDRGFSDALFVVNDLNQLALFKRHAYGMAVMVQKRRTRVLIHRLGDYPFGVSGNPLWEEWISGVGAGDLSAFESLPEGAAGALFECKGGKRYQLVESRGVAREIETANINSASSFYGGLDFLTPALTASVEWADAGVVSVGQSPFFSPSDPYGPSAFPIPSTHRDWVCSCDDGPAGIPFAVTNLLGPFPDFPPYYQEVGSSPNAGVYRRTYYESDVPLPLVNHSGNRATYGRIVRLERTNPLLPSFNWFEVAPGVSVRDEYPAGQFNRFQRFTTAFFAGGCGGAALLHLAGAREGATTIGEVVRYYFGYSIFGSSVDDQIDDTSVPESLGYKLIPFPFFH